MRNRRGVVAAAAVGVSIALVGLLVWRSRNLSNTRSLGLRPTCFGICWEQGKGRTFEISVKTAIEGAQPGLRNEIGLSGKLSIESLGYAPRAIRMSFIGHASGVPANIEQRSVDDNFLRPQIFVLDVNGAPREIRSATSIAPYATQLWTALLWSMQFSSSSSDSDDVLWKSSETDSSGEYEASYKKLSKQLFSKRRIKYFRNRVPGLDFTINQSEINFHFDKGRNLTNFDLKEQITSAKNGPLPEISGIYEYSLRATEDFAAADWRDALREALKSAPMNPFVANQEIVADSMDDARIGGRTFDGVMTRLLEAQKGKTPNDVAQGRDFLALTALLRTDHVIVAKVKEHIVKGGPLSLTLIEALRDAGSVQTQHLLVDLLHAPELSAQNHFEVVRSLGRVGRPTAQSIEALKELRQAPGIVGQQARYGLGSAVYRLNVTDPELAGQALGLLTDELRSTTDNAVKVMNLVAIGNGGRVDAYEAVVPFLKDDAETVRGAAAQALRRMPGASVDGHLAEALRDPSSGVRFSAIDAISEREASRPLADAVSAMLLGETDYKARVEAVRVASGWVDGGYPGIRERLQHVAKFDPDPDLRRMAQDALARSKAGG